MVVGEIGDELDLLVIGGGPGGYVAAARAADLGRDVVLVDRGGPEGGLGGACLHVGCIPSKALIELAEGYARTAALAVRGLQVDGARVDLRRFQEWKNGIVRRLAGGVESLLRQRGVRLIPGEARFVRRNRVVVHRCGEQPTFLEFRDVIIATGSRPATLESLSGDGDRVLTSSDALALGELPSSLAVIGAGAVGVEIGTAMAKLGVDVTIVEALDGILSGIDNTLTAPVYEGLKALGVELKLSARVVGLEGEDLIIGTAEGKHRVRARRVLVAVGRTPNTDALGLEHLGIRSARHPDHRL